MSAAMVAQLLIAFGPGAIDLIKQLVTLWQKPSLSVDEVNNLCNLAKKSYDDYMAAAKA